MSSPSEILPPGTHTVVVQTLTHNSYFLSSVYSNALTIEDLPNEPIVTPIADPVRPKSQPKPLSQPTQAFNQVPRLVGLPSIQATKQPPLAAIPNYPAVIDRVDDSQPRLAGAPSNWWPLIVALGALLALVISLLPRYKKQRSQHKPTPKD